MSARCPGSGLYGTAGADSAEARRKGRRDDCRRCWATAVLVLAHGGLRAHEPVPGPAESGRQARPGREESAASRDAAIAGANAAATAATMAVSLCV